MEKHKADTPLSFKPLTEGLGFHPFSDGLPYAPLRKNRTPTTGGGAVAAGPPSFARPTKLNQATQKAETDKPLLREETFGFSYLFKRMIAYFIDSFFNISVCVIALTYILIHEDIRIESLVIGPDLAFLIVTFLFVFNWALITAQEVTFRSSLGKRIVSLQLSGSSASKLLLRSFLFILSGFFCGIGLLWGLFDKQKRCWHDVVTDIQPVNLTKL